MDFGLLYEGERNAGNDVRRVGRGGAVRDAARTRTCRRWRRRNSRRIVTTDPHTYNTLKNEYPWNGDRPEVQHYTEVLDELLAGRASCR